MTRISRRALLCLASVTLSPCLSEAQVDASSRRTRLRDPRSKKALHHIVLLGQSNAGGAEAMPPVSSVDEGFGNFRFVRGIRTWRANNHPTQPHLRPDSQFDLVPLNEIEGPGNTGETAATGIANSIKRMVLSRRLSDIGVFQDDSIIVSYPHRGGSYLFELDYRDLPAIVSGKRIRPGGAFETFVDDLRRAKQAAEARGWAYKVLAFHFLQGENEDGGRLSPSFSEANHAKFIEIFSYDIERAYDKWNAAAKLVSGQHEDVPLVIAQVANEWSGHAQMVASHSNKNIIVAGPSYHVPSARNSRVPNRRTTSIHLTADSQRWLGSQTAKALILSRPDAKWRPLEPIEMKMVQGKKIIVQFYVPVPPLRWELNWLPMAHQYGFAVIRGSKASGRQVSIASVEILSKDRVIINLDDDNQFERGEEFRVEYGTSAFCADSIGVFDSISYVNNSDSKLIDIEIDHRNHKIISNLLKEGRFIIKQSHNRGFMGVVSDCFMREGKFIMRSDYVVGDPVRYRGFQLFRDRPFGNLSDSDNSLSEYGFADETYGRRQGQRYPLNNMCLIFSLEGVA